MLYASQVLKSLVCMKSTFIGVSKNMTDPVTTSGAIFTSKEVKVPCWDDEHIISL